LDTNTVLIYSSDQGFYNGEHGWFDKRWIYEESLHMPLIVRWPGVVRPGSRFTPLVQNIDYAPTFVEIAGGRAPDNLHGHSLVPILRGETPADWRESLYYHYFAGGGHGVPKHFGLRTDRYTLARFYETDEWELYDLQKDPRQLHSMYADPAYAKTVAELTSELARLRLKYGDNEGEQQPAGN
jgi:arylsulfatase A-like enzyme